MKVAIIHYCEGGGHGPRMLAVAEAFEERGHEVSIAGGGPGAKFIEVNGYEEFKPEVVDFIEDYDEGIVSTLTDSVPKSIKRVKDIIEWLKDEEPDLVVTDDMFAGAACTLIREDYYMIRHDEFKFYEDTLEAYGAYGWNRFFDITAEDLFQPSAWDKAKHTEIGPMALEKDQEIDEEVDVLLIPSAYSENTDKIKEILEENGREVTYVGGEDWELQESLQPFIEESNLVVCSGYSAVMEAAVSGTPCIILPETSEQEGVAKLMSKKEGFKQIKNPEEINEAIKTIGQPEEQRNGATELVDMILDSKEV